MSRSASLPSTVRTEAWGLAPAWWTLGTGCGPGPCGRGAAGRSLRPSFCTCPSGWVPLFYPRFPPRVSRKAANSRARGGRGRLFKSTLPSALPRPSQSVPPAQGEEPRGQFVLAVYETERFTLPGALDGAVGPQHLPAETAGSVPGSLCLPFPHLHSGYPFSPTLSFLT